MIFVGQVMVRGVHSIRRYEIIMLVKLIYYKTNGKYYSGGEYETELEEVRCKEKHPHLIVPGFK